MRLTFVRLLALALLCLPLASLNDISAQQGQKKSAPKGGQQGSPPGSANPAPGQRGSTDVPNRPVGEGASATDYPTKPVRIMIGFAPGGSTDVVARTVALVLSDRLGQPIVIENMPGAAGSVAAQAALRAAPDGYTILLSGANNAINQSLYKQLSFNFVAASEPVAGLVRVPYVMVVAKDEPARNLSSFIEQVKANPGKFSFASGGVGTFGHLSGELFKMSAGVGLMHVSFPGAAQAQVALIGGQVKMMIEAAAAVQPQIKSGHIRAIAVTTAARSPSLPDVPTIGETLQGYESSNFVGLSVPKGTPRTVIDKLNNEINAALADPTVRSRIADLGAEPMPGSPADYGKMIADDTEKWAKVIRANGVPQQ
jgi:tripartite-type tricarboxylate transporter receptor subunit TctC